jgi:hypothetical protein
MPKIWEHSACEDPSPAPTPNAIDAHRVVGLRNNKTPNATPANAPYVKRRKDKSMHLSYLSWSWFLNGIFLICDIGGVMHKSWEILLFKLSMRKSPPHLHPKK